MRQGRSRNTPETEPQNVALTKCASIGRPRVHDPAAMMAKVCAIISEGGTVNAACKELKIHPSQVHDWARRPEFASTYRAARECQADTLAEQVVMLADAATSENWKLVRVQVEARKWLASKIAPRRYGERQHVEHSVITAEEVQRMSDEELQLLIEGKHPRLLKP